MNKWIPISILLFVLGSGAVVKLGIDDKVRNTLGFRLHNPGNIERGQNFLGESAQQKHVRYATFIAPEFGIRALARVLRTYHDKYGLNTVRTLIGRYAPAHENPTDPYIRNVAAWIGVGPDQPIYVPSLLYPLVGGIIRQEIGYGTQPYPDEVLHTGLALERDYAAAQTALARPSSLASHALGLA